MSFWLCLRHLIPCREWTCAEKTRLWLTQGCRESAQTPLCTICNNRERWRWLPARSHSKCNSSKSSNPQTAPHKCTFCLDALPIACLEVQPAQADHSVHRWFVCSLSKFSRHLCKSQHSSPSYLSHQSASETQNWDCLIGYCFTILNEVIFPRTLPA